MEMFVASGILFGIVTALAAQARGRGAVAWFFIGMLGQVFALIAVLVMENLKGSTHANGPRPLAWRSEDQK